jgi:uncharacterized lipoprotein YajG
MKKKILNFALFALVTIMTLFSCQKKQDAISSNGKSNIPKSNLMTGATPMTLGQEHNAILEKYAKAYGIPSKTRRNSMSDVRTIIRNLCQIAIQEGVMIPPNDIEAYLDIEIDQMFLDGFFDSNNMMKSLAELAANAELKIQSQPIRSKIHIIHNYNGSPAGFLTFANDQLDALQNLSASEQETVANYASVLNESNQYWTVQQNNQQIFSVGSIAQADADGAVTGFNAAMRCGYWWLANAYAGYYSARCSLAAAQ